MNAVLESVTYTTYLRVRLDHVTEQIGRLLVDHWREIAHYSDVPLKPDWDRYRQAELNDALRIYVLVHGDIDLAGYQHSVASFVANSTLIGYAVYFLPVHPHYSSTKFAVQDILYLEKEFRRGSKGKALIKHSEDELRAEGVKVIQQHTKIKHNIGPLLERMGYEPMDVIYTKRLD